MPRYFSAVPHWANLAFGIIAFVVLIGPVGVTSAQASTVTVNFDAGVPITGTVPTYTENGFSFAQYACSLDISTIGFVASPFGTGQALQWDPAHCVSDLLVYRTGGGTFDLVSFDSQMGDPYAAVQACSPGQLPANMGGSVPCTQGFNPGALPAHNGTNYTGLSFVDFCSYCLLFDDSQGGILDNFVFTVPDQSAPEPITLSLSGAGLAGAVVMLRRKKKSV
jgi:hypothetical protein